MLDSLKIILEIQELDVKMIRLVRLKKQRQKELSQIELLTTELRHQLSEKERQVHQMTHEINQIEEINLRLYQARRNIAEITR